MMSSNHDFSTVKDIFHKRVKLKQGNTMNTHTHTRLTALCPGLPTMKNTTILSQGQLQLRKKLD